MPDAHFIDTSPLKSLAIDPSSSAASRHAAIRRMFCCACNSGKPRGGKRIGLCGHLARGVDGGKDGLGLSWPVISPQAIWPCTWATSPSAIQFHITFIVALVPAGVFH